MDGLPGVLGDGGDKHTNTEHHEEEYEGGKAEQPQAAVEGHPEKPHTEHGHHRHIDYGNHKIGDDFAQNNGGGPKRHDRQLFQCAGFSLTH